MMITILRIHNDNNAWPCGRGAGAGADFGSPTVSFHNFKSQNFKLSVSNPKNKYVAYLSVLSQISNCQGLGHKNKHDILKTDRTPLLRTLEWASHRPPPPPPRPPLGPSGADAWGSLGTLLCSLYRFKVPIIKLF